jgi:hypothetical protein
MGTNEALEDMEEGTSDDRLADSEPDEMDMNLLPFCKK